jgi:diadenosine tetraphosphate (Ap4A) HIT family hydrolase
MVNQTAVRFGYPQTVIREYDHWLVLLREPQATLGSLILCAKADVTEFSALPAAAFAEMDTVVKEMEQALKAAFSYDKINYMMLMMVDPNVHFHVIPRYSKTPSACGLGIPDPGWPALPQLGEGLQVTPEQRDALREYISTHWQASQP